MYHSICSFSYYRQFLTTANLAVESDYLIECPDEWCFGVLDYLKLHVLTTRFLLDDEVRVIKSKERLRNITNTVASVIK